MLKPKAVRQFAGSSIPRLDIAGYLLRDLWQYPPPKNPKIKRVRKEKARPYGKCGIDILDGH